MSARCCLILGLLVWMARTAGAGEDAVLAARLDALSERLEQRRQDLHIPGMSLAVVHGDAVVLARGFGMRDVAEEAHAKPETRYAIGSTTKAFTSALIAILAGEGRLDFDDPIRKHLEYFKLQSEPAGQPATLTDLLSHRTGLNRTDYVWLGTTASREELIRNLAETKPTAPFRTRFQYNNVQYLAAGQAAAAVAGCTWEELLKQRILGPLGMSSTTTSYATMRDDPEAAFGYGWDITRGDWKRAQLANLETIGPAGSIYSSVLDMAKWVRLLLRRGKFEGRVIVPEAQLERCWKTCSSPGGGVDYGMGWMLHDVANHRTVEHGGNIFGFSAEVGLFPDDDFGFVLLTNLSATPLQSESVSIFADTVLQGKAVPAAKNQNAVLATGTALSAEELQLYLGPYYSRAAGLEFTVTQVEGSPALHVPNQGVFKLRWPVDGAWQLEGVDAFAKFDPVKNDRVWTLHFHQGGGTIKMDRPEPEELPITIDELMDLHLAAHGRAATELPGRLDLTGTLEIPEQGLKGTARLCSDGDDFRLRFDFGKFGAVDSRCVDGSCVHSSAIMAAQPLSDDKRILVQLLHPAALVGDLRDYCEEVEVLRKRSINGNDVYIVRARASTTAPSSLLTFDAKTGALMEQTTESFMGWLDGVPTRIRYDGWEDCSGLRIPTQWNANNPLVGPITIRFHKLGSGAAVNVDWITAD